MRKKAQALVYRTLLNAWPCLAGTGGRVTHLSEDFTRLKVELPLSWRTRNAVGTIYGGSMYASTDPFYMLMLMRLLGKSYVVWDKGCTIRFKRPAKVTLHADFHVTPEMLDDVKRAVADAGSTEFTWTVRYKDADGVVYAEFDKVLYVATKAFYAQRQKDRESASASA
jgi:acyl-coenzyme A thioesterase PaaI-like protein